MSLTAVNISKRILLISFLYLHYVENCFGIGFVSVTRKSKGDIAVYNGDGFISSEQTGCDCIFGGQNYSDSLDCSCHCNETFPIFREDTLTCVQDVIECQLDSFEKISQAEMQKKSYFISLEEEIPQLDLNHPNEQSDSLFCIVVKGQFLTRKGWNNINGSSLSLPLRLNPDKGNISFKWTENLPARKSMEGQLLLLHLFCKNSESTSFQQCVTFRIGGNKNITKSVHQIKEGSTKENSLAKGIIIAVGLLLASLTISYGLISFFYFRVKRNKLKRNETLKRLPDIGKGKYGFSNDHLESKNIKNILIDFPRKKSVAPVPPEVNESKNVNLKSVDSKKEEEDDIYSTPSLEEEIEGRRQRYERLKNEIEAMKKLRIEDQDFNDYEHYEVTASTLGLAIVETTEITSSSPKEVQMQKEKSIGGMKPRKRLFFNPSYFEPEMLQSPPPAAVEFLSNVRQMMAVAKEKIQMKSFQPTLIDIPEDYGVIKERKTASLSLNSKSVFNFKSEEDHTANKKSSCYSTAREKDAKKGPAIENMVGNNSNIIDDCQMEKFNADKALANEMARTTEKTTNNIIQVDDNISLMNKNDSNRNLQLVPMPPRNKFINSSCKIGLKRHKSLRENTQAFKTSMEAIKQEIHSRLTRVSSLSKIQFPKQNNELSSEKPPDFRYEDSREKKVQRWLHSIDCNNYDVPRASDFKADLLVFDELSRKGSNYKANKPISKINCCKSGNENNSISSYLQNDEPLSPYQQDNEVCTIEFNTTFRQNTDPQNNSNDLTNYSRNYSSDDNEYLLPNNLKVQTSLCHEQRNSTKSPKLQSKFAQNTVQNKSRLNSTEEHSYEEIQYNKYRNELENNYYTSSQFDDDSTRYETVKDLPVLSVSECVNNGINVLDNIMHENKENNFLCIELSDSKFHENSERTCQLSQKESKNCSSIKRSDSIVQDSLERPKFKKNKTLNLNETLEQNEILSFFKRKDSFNNNYKYEKPLTAVRRSKTLKTFKDYKKIKFCSSKFAENKLTFFGEGISLNYKNGNKTQSSLKGLPLKSLEQKKVSTNFETESKTLFPFHSTNISLGSHKSKIRYSNSFTPIDFHRKPMQIFHIYGERDNCSVKSDNLKNIYGNKTFNDNASQVDLYSNDFKSLDINDHQFIINNLNNSSLENSNISLFKPYPKRVSTSHNQIISESMQNKDSQLKSQSTDSKCKYTYGESSIVEKNRKKQLKNYLSTTNNATNLGQNFKDFLDEINDLQEKEIRNESDFHCHLNYFQALSKATTRDNHNEPPKVNLKKSNSITLQNYINKNTGSLVHRSISLHRMAQGGLGKSGKLTISDQANPKFSLYVNDAFHIED